MALRGRGIRRFHSLHRMRLSQSVSTESTVTSHSDDTEVVLTPHGGHGVDLVLRVVVAHVPEFARQADRRLALVERHHLARPHVHLRAEVKHQRLQHKANLSDQHSECIIQPLRRISQRSVHSGIGKDKFCAAASESRIESILGASTGEGIMQSVNVYPES